MPLSYSPCLLPAAEIPGDIRPQEDRKDYFHAELPVCTQVSPPSISPQPCEETMSIATTNRVIAPSDNHQTHQPPMILNPGSIQWPNQGRYPHNGLAQDSPAFCIPTVSASNSSFIEYSQQAQNSMSYNTNYNLTYPTHYTPLGCPRMYNSIDLSGLPSDIDASYPPATFFHTPPQPHDTLSLPDSEHPELIRINNEYDVHYASRIKQKDQLDYNSPYTNTSRASTPYSNTHEDGNTIDKEQPYAQLIYRALLDAPNHTMVLRDIYEWFLRYTDKAVHSETKGWQNSIRHNLSMNGAFEKVDSPSNSSSKGFMWRLTPSALREGVKSTTRYRSKAPNKRTSTRTQPLPQRQASGAKGGHAARRAAHLRRSQRAREAYPRSNPYSGGWGGESVYSTESSFPPRAGSPYSQYGAGNQGSFNQHRPKSPSSFQSMPGMVGHLASPPRSYASTPVSPAISMGMPVGDTAYVLEHTPGEPLFTASPTPSGDEPITPVERRGMWQEDVAIGAEVYDGFSYVGSA